MMYKFWLSRLERKKLNQKRFEAAVPKIKEDIREAFKSALLYSDDSIVWMKLRNAEDVPFDTVLKSIDDSQLEGLIRKISSSLKRAQ